MSTGFQQQRPFGFTAGVRSTPSPQHAARLKLDHARPAPDQPVKGEEKSFDPHANR